MRRTDLLNKKTAPARERVDITLDKKNEQIIVVSHIAVTTPRMQEIARRIEEGDIKRTLLRALMGYAIHLYPDTRIRYLDEA